MRFLFFLCVASMLFQTPSFAAGEQSRITERPQELQELLGRRFKGKSEAADEYQNMRPKAVKDVAFRLGIQEGARWQNKNILEELKKNEFALDRIYRFGGLLVDSNVLPPVIVQSRGTVEVKDKKAVKTASSYKIISDARFVSNPPSWRDYLVKDEQFSVQKFDESLYPKNKDEEAVWKQGVENGWKHGISQANEFFVINHRRLVRDFRGMLLFRMLSKQGYVSLPKVSSGKYAVRIGERTLDLDQTTFDIVRESRFQSEEEWKNFQLTP